MKSNINLYLYYFVQLTWGIIQNILGFLIWLTLSLIDPKTNRFIFNGAIVTRWKLKTSSSIGIFIFLGQDDDRVLVHEYGHTIQSCILGPLYLIVVGIPSFIWCNMPLVKKIRRNRSLRYSSFYSEKWANYLGKKYTNQNSINY